MERFTNNTDALSDMDIIEFAEWVIDGEDLFNTPDDCYVNYLPLDRLEEMILFWRENKHIAPYQNYIYSPHTHKYVITPAELKGFVAEQEGEYKSEPLRVWLMDILYPSPKPLQKNTYRVSRRRMFPHIRR